MATENQADEATAERPTFIVGIGASAGGLEAIEQFFDTMPADTGVSFVLVQHLSPDYKSLMDELLARHTEMVIHQVQSGMLIEPNCVYLLPPRKNMVLRRGRLHLTDQSSVGGLNLPIDVFFSSLADEAGKRGIAVVLSGTGSDGSRGVQKVHESGGLVLVQSAATAGFDGMPRSANATGMADVVTSPAEMPNRILQYVKDRDVRLHPDTHEYSAPTPLRRVVASRPNFDSNTTRPDGGDLIPEVQGELLREYVPPSLLIDSSGELMHCFGDARDFLKQPEGKATFEILRMVDGELRMALSTAMHRARSTNEPVVMKSVPAERNGELVRIRLSVKPYNKGSDQMLLACFEQETDAPPVEQDAINYETDDLSMERIIALERELAYHKETLQATVEELETSNEELQSTNEKLHSVNDELHTVNSEYQRKIQELTQLTSDMDNMLEATQVGTIFLDHELKIRKFTSAIAKAFYMLPQDVGRPIEHIASNLDLADLHDDVRRVVETGVGIEREARNRDGQGFLMRIQPYREMSDDIGGVVLTCVDVSAILSSVDEIRRTAESLELNDVDLQEFAYAVSHDLQAPLRHIANHTRQLREEHLSSLDGPANESLTAISASVSKLESMIIGLLKYSRVYSRGKPFQEVCLDEALTSAKRRLRGLIDESGAQIQSDPLPTLSVDVEQIATVFQKLFDNAITYARESPPVIRITAEKTNSSWQIDVRDNGIGIAPQHRERIFVIFERLEFRSTPGEGLGLSIAKRIMQRHGGSIRALRDGSERGSVFRLQLPHAPKSPPGFES